MSSHRLVPCPHVPGLDGWTGLQAVATNSRRDSPEFGPCIPRWFRAALQSGRMEMIVPVVIC